MTAASELKLEDRAIHQRWPIPYERQVQILERAFEYCDQDSRPQVVIAAMGVVARFAKLSLDQQALDLEREKMNGRQIDVKLSDCVEEAERLAEARGRELESEGERAPT